MNESKQFEKGRHPRLNPVVGAGLMTCLLLLAATGCREQNPSADVVLARVGDEVITRKEFLEELDYRRDARRPVESAKALLDEIIFRRQALMRARSTGLADDPEIRRELDNLLIGRLRDAETGDDRISEVTEEELKTEYKQRLEEFTKPAKSRLAILFLETPGQMSETRQEELHIRMKEARSRALEQPAPTGRGPGAQGFGALAVEFSDDQASRYRGGDIGWLDNDRLDYRWPQEVLEAGYALEKGEVSEWIKGDKGFYLVTRTDFRDSSIALFEQVSPSLKNRLMAERRQANREGFKIATAGMFPAVINTNALTTIDLTDIASPRGGEVPNAGPTFGPGNNLLTHEN